MASESIMILHPSPYWLNLFAIQCKYPVSEVNVEVVAEPDIDNKVVHCHALVLQKHCPFLWRSLECIGCIAHLTKYPVETSRISTDCSCLSTNSARLDIICEAGGKRTDGLNKKLTQNINLCAGSSHFVTSLISSFTGAKGRYLRKAIIPAQQQPLPLGLCIFNISHDKKPAGRSPAPVTCCFQILRNRVYHYFRCYFISAPTSTHWNNDHI